MDVAVVHGSPSVLTEVDAVVMKVLDHLQMADIDRMCGDIVVAVMCQSDMIDIREVSQIWYLHHML